MTSAPKRTLTACCTAHTLHDGLSDMSYVLLPMLAQSFGLTLAQVGLVRSALRAAMALFQTPAGLLAERLGARNLLAFGTACAGLSYIALGQASGFVAVLLAFLTVIPRKPRFRKSLGCVLKERWPRKSPVRAFVGGLINRSS